MPKLMMLAALTLVVTVGVAVALHLIYGRPWAFVVATVVAVVVSSATVSALGVRARSKHRATPSTDEQSELP